MARKCARCKAVAHRCLDPYTCHVRGVSIHRHHIIPRKFGGSNDPENVVDLCSSCHARVHQSYTKTAITVAFEKDPQFFKKCLRSVVGRAVR